jgi:RND superfamily putative drug exporter
MDSTSSGAPPARGRRVVPSAASGLPAQAKHGPVERLPVKAFLPAIMIAVFTAFVFGGQRVIAEFGIGLAAAVFLDAFILRTVLVPSMMHIFGRANWWLPRAVDRRMSHLSVEPTEDEEIAAEPAA